MRTGEWVLAAEDVEETEVQLAKEMAEQEAELERRYKQEHAMQRSHEQQEG
jgi:hypothetical protein